MSQATGPYRDEKIFSYIASKLRPKAPPFVLPNENHGSFHLKAPILVALSGGADSVFLLHFLLWLNIPTSASPNSPAIVAAHARHNLRDSDNEDAIFCQELCDSLDIPLIRRQLHTPDNKRPQESSEMAARRLRYNFLLEVKQNHSCAAVALGHHAQDQMETLLLRLGEGTGPRGLRAMEPYSPPFWRPLLPLSKEKIIESLRANKIPWIEDPSNSDRGHLRNRIRPIARQLMELFPRLEDNLDHTTELLRRQENWLNQKAHEWLKQNSLSGAQTAHSEQNSPFLCLYGLALWQEEEFFQQKIIENAVLRLDNHFHWNRRSWATLSSALRRWQNVAGALGQPDFSPSPNKQWCPHKSTTPHSRRHQLWHKGSIAMELWRPESAVPWLLLISQDKTPRHQQSPTTPSQKPPPWHLAASKPGRLVFACAPAEASDRQWRKQNPCRFYRQREVEMTMPQLYTRSEDWQLSPWAELWDQGLYFAVTETNAQSLPNSSKRKLNKIIKNSLARPWRFWLPILLYKNEPVALLYSLLPDSQLANRFSAKLKRFDPPLILSIS